MKILIGALVFYVSLLLVIPQAREVQSSVPAQTPNVEIIPFHDINEDGNLDGNEAFMEAEGELKYLQHSEHWIAGPGFVKVYVPNGVTFTLSGDILYDSFGVYDCAPVTYTMPDEGEARAGFPCIGKHWWEWVNHLYVSFITSEARQ